MKAVTTQDDQPITRKDLQEFAALIITQLRTEMKAQGEDLRSEMKAQGEELRCEMKAQGEDLRSEIKEQGDTITKQFDSKLQALKTDLRDELHATRDQLMYHTEETVGEHGGEILQSIADVVQPMQRELNRYKRQLARLLGTTQ